MTGRTALTMAAVTLVTMFILNRLRFIPTVDTLLGTGAIVFNPAGNAIPGLGTPTLP
jgi:hypothetical protein